VTSERAWPSPDSPAPADQTVLNVAATALATRALGPGRRAVVWVQGCPFSCPSCVAPDWIPNRPARRVPAADLVDELCADEAIDGFTFSGGEPMTQAAGLAELIRLARRRRPELTLVCFTGYRLAQLRTSPPSPWVAGLLAEVDVLIDGRYVEVLNDNRGLRGSSNQRTHHLTDRLRDQAAEFECERRAEVVFGPDEVLMIGVPPHGLLASLDSALRRLAGPRTASALTGQHRDQTGIEGSR
jgi:anaerobic ribonucleoside-triphosphate reductase activating protein